MHKIKQDIPHVKSEWHKKMVWLAFVLMLTGFIQPAYAINEEVKQKEHMAAMGLASPEDATHITVQSGKWSDQATWGGVLPTAGARIYIGVGHEVTVDGQFPDTFMTIRVDGTLRFATDVNTELRVDTMITGENSVFEMGTVANPIAKGVTAMIVIDDYNNGFETENVNSPDYDPFKLGQGIIAHGRFVMQGAEKTGYGTINGASIGDTILTLDEVPNDWNVGDRIVIAGTKIDAKGDEVRTIEGIDTDSNTISLNEALAKDHLTPPHNKKDLVLKVHVANTTRNARIETAEENRAPSATMEYLRRGKTLVGNIYEGRGHVMFMHHNNVQVRYGEFLHLGRSNRGIPAHGTQMDELGNITQIGLNSIARYPVHFHRSGSDGDKPALVHGCSVFESPGWGYVNHGGYVVMSNNVAYDIGTFSYVTERSDERGAFIGNLSIKSQTGIWTQGPLIFLRNNIVSGAKRRAYAQQHKAIDGLALKSALKRYNKFPERLRLEDLERKTQPSSMPFNEHTGNLAYASGAGIVLNGYHPGRSYHQYGEFVDFTAWNVGSGAQRAYASMVRLTNPTFINDPATPGEFGTENISMIDNPHIEGFLVGISARVIGTAGDITTAGIFGKYAGRYTEGGYLNNLINIVVDGKRGGTLTTLRNITFGKMSSEHVAIAEAALRAFGNHSIARNKFHKNVKEADATSLADLHNVDVSRQQNILLLVDFRKASLKSFDTYIGLLLAPDRFTFEIDGFVYDLMAKREQHADFVPFPSWLYPVEEGYVNEKLDIYRDLTNAEMFALSQETERTLDPKNQKDIAFPDRGASVGGYFIPTDWQTNPDYLDGDDFGMGNVVLKKMRDQNGDAIAVDWQAANAGPVTQPDFVEFVQRTFYQPNLSPRPVGTLIVNDEDSDWKVLNPFGQGIIPKRHWTWGAPYNSVLTVVNMEQPRVGKIGAGTQQYTYERPDGFVGIDSFRYHVADITGKDKWETAYIFAGMDVDPSLVNFMPEAGDDEYTVVRGETTVFDVLANDTDPEGGDLSIVKVGHPERNTDVGWPHLGTAEIVGGQIRYTADPFFIGTDRFVYYAKDDAGNMTRRGMVSVYVEKSNIISGNTAPEAVDDSVTAEQDSAVTINVLRNDSDADSDLLSVISVTDGVNGTTVVNEDGTITYTPDVNFMGNDSFGYTISDGNGGEGSATVNVAVAEAVSGSNSNPVAVNDKVTTDQDIPVIVNVLGNDIDADGDLLSVISVINGVNGTTVINSEAAITYTPVANFFGNDSFSYTISDSNGGEASATVNVTIAEALNVSNTNPVAVEDSVTTDQDIAVIVNVLGNDIDADGDFLSVISAMTINGSNGTIVINNDRTITYTPDDAFSGKDSFIYTVSDGNGGEASAVVDVTVVKTNSHPVAIDDSITTDPDIAVIVNVLANDSDEDGDLLRVLSVVDGANGTVVINSDNTITYTPNVNFLGDDSVTYTVSDGNGGEAGASVNVTVIKANSNPTAVDDNATTDQNIAVIINVLDNDSDADDDILSVISVVNGANGTAVINEDGTITYTPNVNFFGNDLFDYTVSDGNRGEAKARVNVTVAEALSVNNSPVAVNDSATTEQDITIIINVLANDIDANGDILSVISVVNGANGTTVVNGDGTITYTPDVNFSGNDSFNYTISDGNGGNATATVIVKVGGALSDDLVLEYTFKDGTASDSSPYGNDNSGTLQNGATVNNGILTLDGIDDVVAIADSSDINDIMLTQQRTISLSFNANNVSGRQVLYEEGGPNGGLNIYIDNGILYVGGWNTKTNNWNGTFLLIAVNAGEWHTVTLTLDGKKKIQEGAFRGYLNGELFGSGVGSEIAKHGGDVRLGGLGKKSLFHDGMVEGIAYFGGQIDDLRIYNRILSGSEIAQLSSSQNNGDFNNSPVAVDDSVSTDQNISAIVNVLGNDIDANGDLLKVLSVIDGANGTTVINGDDTISYTPDINFIGNDSFSYTISDGNGGEATATVNVKVGETLSSNTSPVALDDSVTTDQDTGVIFDVLRNDSDADGDSLSILSATDSVNGTTVVNGDGTITYTPAANFSGKDSFNYTISDGNGSEATATVNVTVAGALSDNLVLEYTFEDGTANDGSPYGNDNSGTLLNGAIVDIGVLTLDGVDDVVAIADSSDINMMTTQQRTISLSFNANNMNGRQVLYEEGGPSGGLNIYIDNGKLFVGGWNTKNNWFGTFLLAAVNSSEWHTVTLTLDGSKTIQEGTLRVYLGGEIFGIGAASEIGQHGGDVRLGGLGKKSLFHDGMVEGIAYFSGQIDDLRIYNRTLSGSEVAQLSGAL